MDIPSFIYLISNQKLTFFRADLFEDRFEGLLPEKTAEALNVWANKMITDGQLKSGYGYENLSELLNRVNKRGYLSCWCKESHEMVHMWKIYSKENGICIETTYEDLISSCDFEDSYVNPTEIQYLDFKNDLFPYNGNGLAPFTIKRKEYKSENEFRLIMSSNKKIVDYLQTLPNQDLYKSEQQRIYESTPILLCDVKTKKLISRVHLSPYAPSWYYEVVRNLLDTYNLSDKQLLKSDL